MSAVLNRTHASKVPNMNRFLNLGRAIHCEDFLLNRITDNAL